MKMLLFIFFILGACSKDKNISKLEMFKLATGANSSFEMILPKDINSGVKCLNADGSFNYGPGCLGAHQVKVGDLDFVAIEYENEEYAKKDAKRLNQCFFSNWVFDEVAGEPSLQAFVNKAYNATCP